MPFYLKEKDILPQVDGLASVLIVPCRFCPAASLAVAENKPYIELFRRFLRTEAYETFIQALRLRLEAEGIKAAVFYSNLPHQFVACMWTSGRRRELAKRAAEFEGIVVLGCEAAVETVRNSIGSSGCRVIQGMETEGIMNVVPAVSFPFNVSLVMQGITTVKWVVVIHNPSSSCGIPQPRSPIAATSFASALVSRWITGTSVSGTVFAVSLAQPLVADSTLDY